MLKRGARIAIILVAFLACADTATVVSPRVPVISSPALALNPSYGFQDFHITGFSYGPNFEEYDPGSCHGTYNFTKDSVQVWSGPPPAYVVTEKWTRVGCAIGQPTDGPYVGGNATYYISNSDVSGSVLADGAEDAWLLDVPKDPAGTLYLNAYPNPGYQFLQWVVYPSTGGSYFETSSSISRTLGTSDWHFHVEFKKLN